MGTHKAAPTRHVAAYCRVSTDMEEQESSYEAQVRHYTDYINMHADWDLAGIYADEGITGTSTKFRTNFNRMMDDARSGSIDMIITKSISRFSRNTLDCLKYIRELRELHIPVLFEKENINTLDARGEVLLTVLASLAQQEAESISKNVRMGIQYRYQKGIVMVNHAWLLGYTKTRGGKLTVVPEEAVIVQRIFKEYMDGANVAEIKRILESEHVKSPAGKDTWSATCIKAILQNEKYIGDALLQKTYVKDCLSHKVVRNNGEFPQYYIENDHEPIVSKELFYLVQGEIARRDSLMNTNDRRSRPSSRYALSGRMLCSCCGSSFKRYAEKRQGHKTVWRCRGRLEKVCDVRNVFEDEAQEAVMAAIRKLPEIESELIAVHEDSLKTIEQLTCEFDQTTDTLRDVYKKFTGLMQASESSDAVTKHSTRMDELKTLQRELLRTRAEHLWKDKQTMRLLAIARGETPFETYDETEVRKILEFVYINDDEYKVVFRNGSSIIISAY